VRVRLGQIDDISLEVTGTVVERLDAAPEALDEEGDDELELATSVAIAMDLDEPAGPEGGQGTGTAAGSAMDPAPGTGN